jgi:biotin carboxylase
VSDPKEALHAAKELGSRVVVKPAASAGAEDVYFCRELDAVSSAFGRVQGKTNALGDLNREVVIQELLEGDEYIVNTVSANGVHRVTDIWRCEKILMPGYGKLSALEELLPFEGAEQATLTCYVHRVLHAVGILHGPAHIELIMTRSGPRLMEVAARLQGAVDPSALTAALGTTHIDQTVDAYIDPYGFASRALIPYELKQRVFRVFVICHRTGQLLSIPGIPKLQSLSSFFAAVFYKQPGTRIAQTIDYFTSPGLVHLVHADRFRLQRDYVSLRALEKDGLFEIQS